MTPCDLSGVRDKTQTATPRHAGYSVHITPVTGLLQTVSTGPYSKDRAVAKLRACLPALVHSQVREALGTVSSFLGKALRKGYELTKNKPCSPHTKLMPDNEVGSEVIVELPKEV
jgi:hypothetical protein